MTMMHIQTQMRYPRPVEEPIQQIPIPTTTGNQIYMMLRKARDVLAECISLGFCTTELCNPESHQHRSSSNEEGIIVTVL